MLCSHNSRWSTLTFSCSMSLRTIWTWPRLTLSRPRSRSTPVVSLSSPTTSVSVAWIACSISCLTLARAGLISQVAEELWEVKNRKIENLTKKDITIVDYKNMLVKNSTSPTFLYVRRHDVDHCRRRSSSAREGEAVQQVRRQRKGVNAPARRPAPALPFVYTCACDDRCTPSIPPPHEPSVAAARIVCFRSRSSTSSTVYARRETSVEESHNTPRTSLRPLHVFRRNLIERSLPFFLLSFLGGGVRGGSGAGVRLRLQP